MMATAMIVAIELSTTKLKRNMRAFCMVVELRVRTADVRAPVMVIHMDRRLGHGPRDVYVFPLRVVIYR